MFSIGTAGAGTFYSNLRKISLIIIGEFVGIITHFTNNLKIYNSKKR